GAKVVITDMHLERCLTVADQIKKDFSGDVLALQCDVTKLQDIEEAITKTIKQFGKIDILFNNAGTNRPSQIVDITDDVWELVINTSLRGTFYCCRAILPIMMKQDFGRIVSTTSVAAFRGLRAGHAHYAAAKAGIIAFTRCLAMEAAPYHITANTIAPSFIYNEFIPHIYPQDEIERMYDEIPYPRKGTPDDIANTVLFLVAPEGEYITGQTICVTGGSWMR
ncbi:MAG: SDR family NAD(P)-dependent oxidoreductase, partial [Syntrophorhabdus sp.]